MALFLCAHAAAPTHRPKETRFISPSFTGNFFSCPDLNAITPESSPAFTLQTQHPTGDAYAEYLCEIRAHEDVDVATGTEVKDILVQKRETEEMTKAKSAEACQLASADTEEADEKADPGDGSGAENQEARDKVSVHENVRCDVSRMFPIVGTRFHRAGDDFDLCEAEFERLPEEQKLDFEVIKFQGATPVPYGQNEPAAKEPGSKESAADADAEPADETVGAARPAASGGGGGSAAAAAADPESTSRLQQQLCDAVASGKIADVRAMLERGADPNTPGDDALRLPMFFASKGGHLSVVALLLEHGADVHIALIEGGVTSLFMAAQVGDVAVAAMLLKHKADPNQATIDDGQSPLYMAAQQNHGEVVEMLLEHNADPKLADLDDGRTPLWIASGSGNANIVTTLLKYVPVCRCTRSVQQSHRIRASLAVLPWCCRGIGGVVACARAFQAPAGASQRGKRWAVSAGVLVRNRAARVARWHKRLPC